MATDYLSALNAGSGLDTKAMVDAIVGAQRAPAQSQIDRQKESIETEISGLGQLKGALSTLRSAMSQLNDAREFNFASLSNSSPDKIYATFTGQSADAGTHEITVTQLAKRSIWASDSYVSASADQGGNAPATFSFSVGGGASIDIALAAGEVSLDKLAEGINDADAGVSARVIAVGDGTYRLFIESDDSGADAVINVTADPFEFDAAEINDIQTGLDAEFVYNGVSMTRSSNLVSDLASGLQLSFSEVTDSPVLIEVTQDNASGVAAIESLVASYNAFEQALTNLSASENEDGEKAELYGDSLIRSIRNQMRAMVLDDAPTGGATIKRLSDMGVTFDRYGQLQVNTDELTQAINDNYDEVKTLFTAGTDDQTPYGTANRGLAGDIIKVVDDYLKTTGLVTTRVNSNNQRLSDLDDDQVALDANMSVLEERMTKQFTTMNRIVDEMKSLQSYLDGQLSNLPFTAKND
jgi:flagellar hook-associated protein 2